MPLVLKDRVKETSTTTGTGTLTLGGAATGFQSFAVIGNGNTTYYAIFDRTSQAWEVGVGTYTSSGTTLTRDSVLESSNSGSLVNFGAGTKDVFCTYPAGKAVTLDDVQTLSNKTLASPTVSGNLAFTGTGNRITGDFSNATLANRVMFQTSTVNAGTNLALIPNGTIGAGSGSAHIRFEDSTSIATGNGSFGQVLMVQDNDFRIGSNRTGTGTYLPMTFYTGGSERVRIDTSGNVVIGTSSLRTHVVGTTRLQVEGLAANEANIAVTRVTNTVDAGARLTLARTGGSSIGSTTAAPSSASIGSLDFSIFDGTNFLVPARIFAAAEGAVSTGSAPSSIIFQTSANERARIDSSGNLLVGSTSLLFGGVKLSVNGVASSVGLRPTSLGGTAGIFDGSDYYAIWAEGACSFNANSRVLGNFTITGSLSKGSGSFKIDHPLPELSETHHLVHSFIEGPQADNIYRGKVSLVNGRAEVNIDQAARMTEGTFAALNRNVQCFTSNESDWDAVRGSVEGNILTIECQNTNSTATISWMVIGERQDKHMYDTDWTDEDGRVITEPVKQPVRPIQEPEVQ